ncbi:MAG TPA: methionyl-tRNA formyltransferase, partial [Phycisphaerales bacterium]|nr:methionyl-tRNA formyltransferase [Phycisphaerales bacterium]
MRLVFLGSGAFGLPTVRSLDASHDLLAVVSQPDRPAGRARRNTPTPISEWAMDRSKELIRPEDVNDPEVVRMIRGFEPDALVVIAFGQKIGEPLLQDLPAFNLHASLLPAYRGAAPINRAMIDGCSETGVSVIELAQRMDAGDVHATRTLEIDPLETAGELHDRLAALGPDAVESVLEALAAGTTRGIVQD